MSIIFSTLCLCYLCTSAILCTMCA